MAVIPAFNATIKAVEVPEKAGVKVVVKEVIAEVEEPLFAGM